MDSGHGLRAGCGIDGRTRGLACASWPRQELHPPGLVYAIGCGCRTPHCGNRGTGERASVGCLVWPAAAWRDRYAGCRRELGAHPEEVPGDGRTPVGSEGLVLGVLRRHGIDRWRPACSVAGFHPR